MAGEIQIGGTTFATESAGTITVSNVDSATNRQNLGLEIGVDVQAFDTDTTKNDVANTFTANQIISVTDNTNAALRVTQLGTGNALVVEDSTNPDATPFVVDASGNVGIGTSSPNAPLHILADSSTTSPSILLTDSGVGSDRVGFVTNNSGDIGLISYNTTSSESRSEVILRDDRQIVFSTGTVERMRINTTGQLIKYGDSTSARILPETDTVGYVGAAAARWNAFYASTGTIQTSDENEKQDIEALSDAELRVATAVKSLIKKYKYKIAVSEKGDDARIHVGVIAQEVKAAFEAEGLDAHRYGMFCSDTWYEVDGESKDINGAEYTSESEGAVAKTRLGVRYEELFAFVIAAL